MPKFVCKVDEDGVRVVLDAVDGEEISAEMVAAWAAIRQSAGLNEIAYRLMGIDNALNTLADAVDRSN
ncbi:hypothetical protein C7451_12326 [Blastomonas natatoria]|uniref:Uncharacterized protein n=1 Tax=Blastomonas natatoria TaxID=34015 RepID=A0A2V3UNI1_9SPHN|nr:hypothetical protein [Blastomonas natatoria]PXW67890.1 hypothetical protein C7451_12326 [Blastomonas natatoria]